MFQIHVLELKISENETFHFSYTHTLLWKDRFRHPRFAIQWSLDLKDLNFGRLHRKNILKGPITGCPPLEFRCSGLQFFSLYFLLKHLLYSVKKLSSNKIIVLCPCLKLKSLRWLTQWINQSVYHFINQSIMVTINPSMFITTYFCPVANCHNNLELMK